MQDKLISYGDSNSSWALDIRDVLIDYCNYVGVGATSSYYIGKIGAFGEVENNRPVILFGSFPDLSARGKIEHAVTAYGIQTSGILQYLIVHYGWENYTHIILDAGLVGSNTHFKLN